MFRVLACGGSSVRFCSFHVTVFGLTVLVVLVGVHCVFLRLSRHVFPAVPFVLMYAPLLLPRCSPMLTLCMLCFYSFTETPVAHP
jgi:hypothetical protein